MGLKPKKPTGVGAQSTPGQGGSAKIWGAFAKGGGGASAGDVTSIPRTIDIPQEGDYGNEATPTTIPNPSYNPEAPYVGTERHFLGIPYTAGKDSAAALNLAISQATNTQRALAPGLLSQAQAQADINTQQALAQAGGLQKVAQQGEQYELGQQGKSLVDLAQGGQISYSTIPGKGGSYPDIASAYKMLYGGLANSGAGAAPSSMLSTISGNQAKQAIDVNTKNEALGEAPYASTIGDLTGRGNIQNHQLSQQYAPELAASKALEYKGRALTSGVINGGFDLAGNRYYNPSHEETATKYMTIKGPNGPMQVPISQERKYNPASVQAIQQPVSPEEIAQAQKAWAVQPQVSTVPSPLISSPQPNTPTTIQQVLGQAKEAPVMKNGKLEANIKPKEKSAEEKQKEQDEIIKRLKLILESGSNTSLNRHN